MKTVIIDESIKPYIILEKETIILFEFPNGVGASLIFNGFSFGLELAEIDLETNTVIAPVEGWLSNEEVNNLLTTMMNREV